MMSLILPAVLGDGAVVPAPGAVLAAAGAGATYGRPGADTDCGAGAAPPGTAAAGAVPAAAVGAVPSFGSHAPFAAAYPALASFHAPFKPRPAAPAAPATWPAARPTKSPNPSSSSCCAESSSLIFI